MTARVRIALLAGLLAAVASACTATTSAGGERHSASGASTPVTTGPTASMSTPRATAWYGTPDGVTPLAAKPCLVPTPDSWVKAMSAGRLWTDALDHQPGGVAVRVRGTTGVLHVAADTAGVHVTILGRKRATLATVGTLPYRTAAQQGGVSYMWADADHVVFVYHTAQGDNQNNWVLYLWDVATGRLTAIRHNPTDGHGHPLRGGWIHPYVNATAIYWIEATARLRGYPDIPAGSALMQYSLASGHTSLLYDGLPTSYVVYGRTILFTGVPDTPTAQRAPGGNPVEVTHALDTITHKPVAVPEGLNPAADQPDFIVTNGDIIAWDTLNGHINAWRPAWRHTVSIYPDATDQPRGISADNGPPNSLRLSGPYLAWLSTQVYVLDLRTDSFVRLTTRHTVGHLDGGSALGLWEEAAQHAIYPGEQVKGSAYLVDLSTLPALPTCTR